MPGLDWNLAFYLSLVVSVPQVLSFIFYTIDKLLAKTDGPRIPEMVLLCATFLFGGLGSQVAMVLFRHKTRKSSFKIKFYIVWFLRVLLLVGLVIFLFVL